MIREPAVLVKALVVVAAAFAVKILPSLIFFLRGFTAREVLAAGVLLSARLSLIIAVATVGVELGLLSTQERAIAIFLAAVTATLSPTRFPNPGAPASIQRTRGDGVTNAVLSWLRSPVGRSKEAP